jgi:prepilin signal peptidase PulO-like enzyme (type II secretory pathway)
MSSDQQLVLLIFSGVLGLLVGSFLNVCIFRLPRECMSIVKPRSRCIKCRNFIAWYDNLPVVSWLVLGGKCRHCKAPISFRYVAVELLTGAIFLWAAYVQLYKGTLWPEWHRAVWFGVQAGLASALIVCTFIVGVPDPARRDHDVGPRLGVVVGCVPFIYTMTDKQRSSRPEVPDLAPSLRGGGRSRPRRVGAIVGGGLIWIIGVLGKIAFRKGRWDSAT